MSDHSEENEGEQVGWKPEALAERLCSTLDSGRATHLRGLGVGALEEGLADLRRAISQRGAELIVLDPIGGMGDGSTFRQIVSEYVRRADQRGALDQETRRMTEFLSLARTRSPGGPTDTPDGRLFETTVSRIWKRLSREWPAVLLVANASECSPTEEKVLEHLLVDFFSDPVDELVPELSDSDGVHGVLALLGEASGKVPLDLDASCLDEIDLSGGVRQSVRSYLSRDEVVERFMASTGGDPERMEQLVDTLPSDCTNFWHYRYQQLEEGLKSVLEVLAVAGTAIPVELLEETCAKLGLGTYFSKHVRALTDRGFLRRNIGAGCVTLQLDDPDLGRVVADELGERAAPIHRALAEVARRTHRGDIGDHFVANHFLEAGDADAGFRYGRRAAARLHSEHALEEARELFERILPHAPDREGRREVRHYLLDVYAGLGEVDRALQECDRLMELVEDEEDRARLVCRRAGLTACAGRYDEALEAYRSTREDADEGDRLWLKATAGEAEAHYKNGAHDRAQALARQVLDATGVEEGGDTGDAELDRYVIRARNLRAKVSILRAQGVEARPLIEANRSLARNWGWEAEVVRARANLALIHVQESNHDRAISLLETICDGSHRPDSVPRATLLLNLGMCLQHKGDLEAALLRYRQALSAARQSGDDHAYGLAAYNLGTLYQDVGAFERLDEIVEHLEKVQSEENRHLFIGPLPSVLRVHSLIERESYAEAIEALGELMDSPENATATGPAVMARARCIFGHVELGQIDAAERLLEDIEVDEDRADADKLEAMLQAARALIEAQHQNWEEIEAQARRSAALLREVGHFQEALRISHARVTALLELGRDSEARSVAERRLGELQERGRRVPEMHRDTFYAFPLFQRFVELTQRLNGEVPESFARVAAAAEADGEGQADEGAAQASPEQEWRSTEVFRRWRSRYSNIVGEDERLLKMFKRIDQIADSESPVLIQGESGTGKELIAEAVHRHGHEADDDASFVKVNCGAFVDNLLLSELFGHEKGAFTGAVQQKIGRFEMADGGTIFLDEIGEISPKAQVALLRVLQEGEFERVGGTDTLSSDVRIICATNRDLEQMVESGEFRLDLYYRLKGVVLELPPLRQRRADVPRLVAHFAREYSEGEPKEFSREVLEFMASYSWPGNIRELENFVRTVLLFAGGDTVEMEHVREFGDFFREGEVELEAPDIDYDVELEDWDAVDEAEASQASFADPEEALVEEIVADGLSLSKLKKRIEYESIRRALKETGGNITRAAEILQMTRPRLSQIVNGDESLVELKERLVS